MNEKQDMPQHAEMPRIKKPVSHWYAVYTHSRAEKKVDMRLTEAGIETFLPMQKTLRQWSDRKKLIDRPVISSYIFVKAVPREFLTIRKTDGVVKIINIEGKPAVIPEEQMVNLRILCGSDADITVNENIYIKGDMVEVVYGTLAGLKGELIRIGRKHKVVIRILEQGMNLTVDITAAAIRKLKKK